MADMDKHHHFTHAIVPESDQVVRPNSVQQLQITYTLARVGTTQNLGFPPAATSRNEGKLGQQGCRRPSLVKWHLFRHKRVRKC